MVISLNEINHTIGMYDEHPLARRVGYMLAMRQWRQSKREAEAKQDYRRLDYLDADWERIQGVY